MTCLKIMENYPISIFITKSMLEGTKLDDSAGWLKYYNEHNKY